MNATYLKYKQKGMDREARKYYRDFIEPFVSKGEGRVFKVFHDIASAPKTDGGFQENMQRIAAAHPGSPLDDKFGGSTRTHQELKTRDAIDKHKKRVERSGFSASKSKTL